MAGAAALALLLVGVGVATGRLVLEFVAVLNLEGVELILDLSEVVGRPDRAAALLVVGWRPRLFLLEVADILAGSVGPLLVPRVHVMTVHAPVSLHGLIVHVLHSRGAIVQIVRAVAPVVVGLKRRSLRGPLRAKYYLLLLFQPIFYAHYGAADLLLVRVDLQATIQASRAPFARYCLL